MEKLTGLIPFWDDNLTDNSLTDATLSANKPVRKESVLKFDMPWEGNCTDFFTIIPEDGFFRMYYEIWSTGACITGGIAVCYAESVDGINWVRPSLNIVEVNGSSDNNIIIDKIPDNFTVMKDENPLCPPEMRYKALLSFEEGGYLDGNRHNALEMRVSEDGIHFKHHSVISKGLAYDTQNTLHYDHHSGKYYCFMRAYVNRAYPADERFNEDSVRVNMVMESTDLVNWSEPKELDYGEGINYPLYTNCVSAYPYDDRYYIGFPTRYVERKDWTSTYDNLTGKELRLKRMETHKRLGLALTDCLFMSSRDKYHWNRFEEAILTSGLENGNNWVYGDCYPAVGGVIPTASDVNGEPEELSIYVNKHHWMDVPKELVRYVYRKDGFASYKAPYKSKKIVTKPVTFDGNALYLNMATSARGGIYVNILDENGNVIEGYSSVEIFGDSICKKVYFESELSELKDKIVRFEFILSDAEIFSMTIGD